MRSTRTKSLQNEVLLVPQLYQLTNYNKLTRLRKNEMLHAHISISATLMRDYELAQASDPGRRCSDYVETMYTGNLVLSSILKLLWKIIAHSIANSTFTFQGFSKEMEDPAIRRVAASCSSFHIYAHGSVTALSVKAQ